MICNYGMDRGVGMSYLEKSDVSQTVRDKVNGILEDELAVAIKIIEANKKAIDAMVDALMEKNHLKENEIDEIFKKSAVAVSL